MSSILKALRKVEDEKATLGEGSVDLAHDILKRGYDERKSVPWLLIAILGLLFVVSVAGAIWWFLLPPEVSMHKDSQVTISEEPPVVPPVLPQPALPNLNVESKPADIAPPPIELSAESPLPVATEKVVAEKVPPAVGTKPITIPDLWVEEIVYHQLPTSRLAVINGLPVMEGTDIEGVRIEEILPDRVRCSFQGVGFDKFKVER